MPQILLLLVTNSRKILEKNFVEIFVNIFIHKLGTQIVGVILRNLIFEKNRRYCGAADIRGCNG